MGILGKLTVDNSAQVESDATSGTLKERWTNLYSNYLQTDTDNMFETLADCILMTKEVNFIDYTRIDLGEFSSLVRSDNTDLFEKGGKRALLQANQPMLFDSLAKDLEITIN